MGALRILVAEDDAAIREMLLEQLNHAGFDVRGVSDGGAALRAARTFAQALILDVGLPVVDGFEVLRVLRREHHELPIVLLTARTDEVDRIVAFELGADDYVCKPFSPREVISRVKAVIRRSGQHFDCPAAVLVFGRLQIDEAAREVRVDGKDVQLKPREFALLLALAQNRGVALSRQTLLEKVWGFDFDGDERTVDVHIRRLRYKIQECPRLEPMLRTVHGFGYKFTYA